MNGEDEMNKKLLTGILAIIMTFTLFIGIVAATTNLQDGEYTIQVKAVNSTNGTPSMADTYIKKPVKLEVKGNKIYTILTMSESDIMTDLAAPNSSGGYDAAEIILDNKKANEKTYRFLVASIGAPVTMQVVVAAMGRTVNFNLDFDMATLTSTTAKAAATTTAKPTTTTATTAQKTSAAPIANPKTGDSGFNGILAATLIAGVASVITYTTNKK